MRFKDKVVLVTGGAQGIGKEIALGFAKEGAAVACFDMNQDALDSTANELNKVSKGKGYLCNVTNLSEVELNVNKVIDNFGRVDILVNNAGITRDNLMLRLSESDWDAVISVNLKGAFNCMKILTKPMAKQRGGKIVNISSVIGIMGNAGQVNYAASKAGLIGVTKSLAKELGGRNVTVNAVAPGYIQTAMTDKLDDKVKEKMLARIPLARMGQPSDVAKAVLFLASEDADYITGQVLVVDGGLI
ncbi:MAG: 3-oxoacyl-[acyl-carrier-protein] reductase [Candidatus Omnitrophica bacterium]|nr:3-oxoacyl-[acyl-carrier-protein] reductase [Candidatus Omnitrophota bacterium]MDD5080523.1 3-oxoacyl-[acyl-carrier-protein] reductase [Candidatus Omnitrophota bacterium]